MHPLLHGHTLTWWTNSWVTKGVETCVWDAIAKLAWIVWLDKQLFSKWKFRVQEKCLSSLTAACQALSKMLAQRDLCYIIRFQDAKLTLTSFYYIFVKPFQSLQTSMASLNHQYVSIRLYFMQHTDDASKFLDWNCMTLLSMFLNIIKLLIF